jgi:Endonuclease NucS
MRLLVARCEVLYTGRLTARLPDAVRLLMYQGRRVLPGARRRRWFQTFELDQVGFPTKVQPRAVTCVAFRPFSVHDGHSTHSEGRNDRFPVLRPLGAQRRGDTVLSKRCRAWRSGFRSRMGRAPGGQLRWLATSCDGGNRDQCRDDRDRPSHRFGAGYVRPWRVVSNGHTRPSGLVARLLRYDSPSQ